jgi:hypothetical protein
VDADYRFHPSGRRGTRSRPGATQDSFSTSGAADTRALLIELKAAKARQAAEKVVLGDAYSDLGFVVCNEAGEPYHPSTLSRLWQSAIKDLDVPPFASTTQDIPVRR